MIFFLKFYNWRIQKKVIHILNFHNELNVNKFLIKIYI